MCGKMFSLDSCMDMVQGLMAEQPLPLCSEDVEEASNGWWWGSGVVFCRFFGTHLVKTELPIGHLL